MNFGMIFFIACIALCYLAVSIFELIKELIIALLFYGGIAVIGIAVIAIIFTCLRASYRAIKSL